MAKPIADVAASDPDSEDFSSAIWIVTETTKTFLLWLITNSFHQSIRVILDIANCFNFYSQKFHSQNLTLMNHR